MLRYDTEEAAEKIRVVLEGIASGLDTKCACGIAKLPYSTWKWWLKQAEDGEEPYTELAFRAHAADAERKQIYFATLREAAKEDWKAAAWLLEKLYPTEYGQRATLEHQAGMTPKEFKGAIDDVITVIKANVSDPHERAIVAEQLGSLADEAKRETG